MKSKIEAKGLKDIAKGIDRLTERVTRDAGKQIDLTKEKIFVPGSFLHQNGEKVTEEDSAAFERENPEFFAYLLALDQELRDIF